MIRLVVLCLMLLAGGSVAMADGPLKVDGKATVFQRVLTRPDTKLFEQPGEREIRGVVPFQPHYVYKREGTDWVQIGRRQRGGPEGWVRTDKTIDWRQNLVVSFAGLAGRQRQLMFESQEALSQVISHESSIGTARRLREQYEESGTADKVVTIEPSETIDITENFYLLPILDYTEAEHPMTFNLIKLLKIASLPLRNDTLEEVDETPPPVGLVFVIDTTKSMEPYIDATRNAVRDIVQRISDSEIGKNVRFGVVGFRDSPDAAKAVNPERDLEYRSKVFLELTEDQQPEQVLAGFDEVMEARDSTVNYHEDTVAGIMDAIEMPGWKTAGPDGTPLRQRWIVVISDASPKPPADPHAEYGLSWEDVRGIAEENSIRLVAMHLKTPDGRPNHRAAAAAYRELTISDSEGPRYHPIGIDTVDDIADAFRPKVDEIASFVVSQYQETLQELLERREQQGLDPLEEASLAMRLEWLGRDRNTNAPDVIEAWALDYSMESPDVPSLDVRLLVTKNQIANMAQVLEEILIAGEQEGQQDFFQTLRGAFARLSQNPDILVNEDFETLDQAIGEFLQDLPYSSPILQITEERWNTMGSARRTTMDRVRSKLELYRHIHNDDSFWTELYPGQEDGEKVYAMPFEALP